MQRPQSIQTVFLDQPPSCLEFCPTAPDYFVIGTYLLTEEKSSEDREIRQSKTGSVQLWKLDTASNSLSQVQRLSTPDAVFDLQFSPHDPTIFATATSAADVTLYQIVTSSSGTGDGVSVSQLRTFSLRDDCTVPALYLAWIPPLLKSEEVPSQSPSSTDGFAVSLSDGSISVFHPKESGKALKDVGHTEDLEELQLPNDPMPIEVWYIAFDNATSPASSPSRQHQQPLNIYAGDDFGALRCHQLTSLDDSPEKDSMGTFPAQVQQSTTDRGRFHTAGVTAILPLGGIYGEGNDPNSRIILTGSYDEYIRVYKHSPIPRDREVLAELSLGGGVWRLRCISDEVDQGKGTRRLLVFASCMHAGSRVLRIEHAMDSDSWDIQIIAEFTEHESMNYASGVWDVAGNRTVPTSDAREAGRCLTCVSSSFYDKRLCLWKIDV